MILIKNAEVYAPEAQGRKDVLICNEKIEWMGENPELSESLSCTVVDGSDKILVPGLIDRHVHITGGGGEGGFSTRAPEVNLSALIKGGITTVLGLLGTDGITRSVENLLAKAKALQEEGITAYICSGSYGYPSVTITGEVGKDIVFLQEVLGMKLALSDHRAPNISVEELIRLASDVRTAGMIGKKPGFLVLHMGDDSHGLAPVWEALKRTSIPIKTFQPTHCTRNPQLLEESLKFLEEGGWVDFTCSVSGEISPAQAILMAKERGISTERITCTSDGQGSWSKYDADGRLVKIGVSSVAAIYEEFREMVKQYGFSMEEALTYVSTNPAKAMEIYPQKGCIRPNADADVLLLDKDLRIDTVIARGQIMMQEKKILKKGNYEE